MATYIDKEIALSFPFANKQYDHKNANKDFIMDCETYKEWLENQPPTKAIPIDKIQEVKQEIISIFPHTIQDDYWDDYDSYRDNVVNYFDL